VRKEMALVEYIHGYESESSGESSPKYNNNKTNGEDDASLSGREERIRELVGL